MSCTYSVTVYFENLCAIFAMVHEINCFCPSEKRDRAEVGVEVG